MIIQVLYIDEDGSVNFVTKCGIHNANHIHIINDICDEHGDVYREYLRLDYSHETNTSIEHTINKVIGYKQLLDNGLEIFNIAIKADIISTTMNKEKSLFEEKKSNKEK